MSLASTLSFSQFLIYLGDGGSPENFFSTSPAAFTKKSLKIKVATGSTEVPDTANLTLPSALEIEAKSISLEVSGDGVLDMSALGDWNTWLLAGTARDIRVMLNLAGASGGGYYACQALLTDFSPGATKGEKCTLSVTLNSTGLVSFVANP